VGDEGHFVLETLRRKVAQRGCRRNVNEGMMMSLPKRMALSATFIVAVLNCGEQALAGCFSQKEIEDDAYKGFLWTNNCAS
jgi:hypothetical protein